MNEGIEKFREYLVKQGASNETVISYCRSVTIYYSWYNQLSVELLQNFKADLMERYTINTVNARIHGMNRYLKYLEAVGESAKTGPYRLTSVRQQQKTYLDSVISKRDYEKLKRRLKKDGDMRWYFIVHFLGSTGVRVSELIEIKAEHVAQGYMDLYSKGNKLRRVFFPQMLCAEALAWLRGVGIESGYIFNNRRGERITVRGIRMQLKHYAEKYKIPEETVYPHSFRHRFAINFLNRFNDISLLADLLGHDSIETTKIYLTKSSSEQRALIDRVVTW